jgi:1-deoxy-D-xylulose-5-phosphate reductoisomerase
MKKKIAILGSTGSIGRTLLKIVDNDKKNFEIVLLTGNKNYKLIIQQAIYFKVKNIIITNQKCFKLVKLKLKNKKINIFNNFENLNVILNKKIDYTMCSIVGLDGLSPIIKIIKHTKSIAIANKEPIICAWNLIKRELKKNKTNFIPVDSEHFSIWYALKGKKISSVKKIYLTASGGPLLNFPINKFDDLKISNVLKHPNWKMGKKISIDSSTMMNKVFEVIEAKKIFNISYKSISILIHPKSYIHAILKFNNGMIKIIAHDTTMQIPIFNTLYDQTNKKNKSFEIDLEKLNNLKLDNVDFKRYPLVKIINKLPNNNSLYETVVVSANDELVNLFLNKKIRYTDINKIIIGFINKKEFLKLKKITPRNISQIEKLNKYVRFKINNMGI